MTQLDCLIVFVKMANMLIKIFTIIPNELILSNGITFFRVICTRVLQNLLEF